VPTAAPRGARPKPPPSTCPGPTASCPRATPSTLRAVRSSPLPESLPKEFLTRQATSPLHALHRGYTSELYGTLFIKLLKSKPRFRHQVAHRAAHRWEPCEIGGVVEMRRSENVSDDDVVEKARDGVLRVGKARGSCGDRHDQI